MKTYLCVYDERWRDALDTINTIVLAETESEALGFVLEAFPDEYTSDWTITEFKGEYGTVYDMYGEKVEK